MRGEQYRVAKTDSQIVNNLQLEKLDFESAMQIIEEETILQPQTIEIIEEPKRGSEYRGRKLPLYKVTSLSNEGKEINVYQDPYSGEIVAIRSAQWRIWDLMWGLHIMDWVDRIILIIYC